MLIDCLYFTDGPRHIMNATLGEMPNPNAEEVNAAIEAYIARWQWPFLKGVLGVELAKAATEYLERISSGDNDEPDLELDMVLEQLKEPFANYVFCKILRDANSQATMTGLVRLKCANEYVAPVKRQVSAWNDMVDMLADFVQWCGTSDCGIAGIETERDFLTKINSFNL